MPSIRNSIIRPLLVLGLAFATMPLGAADLRYTRLLSQDVVKALRASSAGGWEGRQRSAVTLESLLMVKPVSVGLDVASDNGEARRTDGLRAGVRLWQEAMRDCPFRLAGDDETPDVVVRFVKDIPDGGDLAGEIEAGRRLQWSPNSRRYTLTATMLIRTHCDGRKLGREEITEVVAHELGHLLGLEDDDREDGLMGPFVPGHPRPFVSQEELRTVIYARDEMRAKIAEIDRAR
jgi:hypothetical protein